MQKKEFLKMYKKDRTTFLERDIPVNLWKSCKSKALLDSNMSMNEVILNLLKTWEQGDINGVQKHT